MEDATVVDGTTEQTTDATPAPEAPTQAAEHPAPVQTADAPTVSAETVEAGIPEQSLAEKERAIAHDFCAKARDKYFEYVNQALRLWDMTRSDGWVSMYKAAVHQNRKVVDNAVRTITDAADQIATAENSEELEKAITDQVKAIKEERTRHAAWFTRTIFPISKLAKDADHVKENVNRQAREKASFNELTDGALPGNVARITGSWPAVEWNEDTGVLSVHY